MFLRAARHGTRRKFVMAEQSIGLGGTNKKNTWKAQTNLNIVCRQVTKSRQLEPRKEYTKSPKSCQPEPTS